MKHFPTVLTTLLLATTLAAAGCNNDGGLLGKHDSIKGDKNLTNSTAANEAAAGNLEMYAEACNRGEQTDCKKLEDSLLALADKAGNICETKGKDSRECLMAQSENSKLCCDLKIYPVVCFSAVNDLIKLGSYDEAYEYGDKYCKLKDSVCWMVGHSFSEIDLRRALEFYQKSCKKGEEGGCIMLEYYQNGCKGDERACEEYNKLIKKADAGVNTKNAAPDIPKLNIAQAPHRERQPITPVFNAEECKFYKDAKLTPDAKTAPKNLSRFLKSFNPSFYEYAIQRFIENPITVTRTAKTCTMPMDDECYLYEQFFLDSNCSVSISEKNAFITVSDAQKYQLNKGDVFPTCLLDSKKSNKSGTECRGKFKSNSYWQVLETTPQTIYQWSQGTDSEECNEVSDKVIFVYDQEGIETRRALYNEIELGMQNFNLFCK